MDIVKILIQFLDIPILVRIKKNITEVVQSGLLLRLVLKGDREKIVRGRPYLDNPETEFPGLAILELLADGEVLSGASDSWDSTPRPQGPPPPTSWALIPLSGNVLRRGRKHFLFSAFSQGKNSN